MKRLFLAVVFLLVFFGIGNRTYAHCEIPCGIYGDEMRFSMIEEHIQTIEKSIKMIAELSQAGEINYNQIVRWVMNKEKHADEIQEIVSQYFLTQRIKPVEDVKSAEYTAYLGKVSLLHEMLVTAMKTKQSLETFNTDKLKELTDKFRKAYFGPEQHEHK